jgi:hypothetical protein
MMKKVVGILLLALIFLAGCVEEAEPVVVAPTETPEGSQILGEVRDSETTQVGSIMIEDVGEFQFNARDIETVRKDIFQEGHFSVFDILVYLDSIGAIDLDYHFDESMNTHVIDSINGTPNWWHMVYYDGGWPENNVFRMDHYPYKDKMYINIHQYPEGMMEKMYEEYRKEVARKAQNNGKIIIPEVVITGTEETLRFTNVEVTAHDLRTDIFQPGTITAIDTIMTLADQNEFTYDLQWYDSISTAGIVRSYWVNRINDDETFFRCGFVYEAGPGRYNGFRGNHIHLPSDTRVLNSPDYLEYFWICI